MPVDTGHVAGAGKMLNTQKKIAVGIALCFAAAAAGTSLAILQSARQQVSVAAVPATTNRNAGNFHLGDALPDFTLQDAEGKDATLASLRKPGKLTLVLTHSPDCPCAANCGKLITDLQKQHGADVVIVGFMSADTTSNAALERLGEQVKDGTVTFPVYYDHDQSVKRLLGATRTPEAWLLDRDGRIAYYGAPENTLFPNAKNHRRLLNEAADAILQGKRPEIERFDPIGCLIGE